MEGVGRLMNIFQVFPSCLQVAEELTFHQLEHQLPEDPETTH